MDNTKKDKKISIINIDKLPKKQLKIFAKAFLDSMKNKQYTPIKDCNCENCVNDNCECNKKS